ncbi:sugar phosphate nucleotidyltransferase [Candidatus Saccharibacteria bacterium]|nr:sugar phosphate nucleotidyltransferase [Candidatus Saccharibacteria bacterium]
MSKITKAIIPVAGWGTRRLPITKIIEKCMLPIGNRPIVDYIVEDCVRGGITDIYFVISRGSTQIKDYYSRNRKLEEYLVANGKEDKLELTIPPTNVNFHYSYQDLGAGEKYGTAVPIAIVLEEIGTDEPVVVVMGDDFIYRPDGGSETADLIAKYQPGEAVMLGVPIDKDDERKFGFLELDGDKLVRIAEAITVDKAPSNLINVSRYVMPPKLLAEVQKFVDVESIDDPEYYITTVPFDNFIKNGGVVRVVSAKGEYLDGGSLEGWLHANEVIGQSLLKST